MTAADFTPRRDGSTVTIPSMLAWAILAFLLATISGGVIFGYNAGVAFNKLESSQREILATINRDRTDVERSSAGLRADIEQRAVAIHAAIESLRAKDQDLTRVDSMRTEQMHAFELRLQRLELALRDYLNDNGETGG